MWHGRPAFADLCCYWFEKARAHIKAGCRRAGLLATQGIRGGANREVLKRIKETAAAMLADTGNPNGRPNSDVVRPVVSAVDICQSSRGKWTIDFALRPLEEAAQYEKPFEYVKTNVYPIRSLNSRASYAEKWWQYAEARPGMRAALVGKSRYIATPGVSKHRLFAWMPQEVLCNQGTLVFARDDDAFFGVLHSRIHEVWARAQGTQLREAESGCRYTPTTSFETFPLPPCISDLRPLTADLTDDAILERLLALNLERSRGG